MILRQFLHTAPVAEACGAACVLSATANVSFPFHPVDDSDVLSLGNVAATILHTPGHTPEHICLLVSDRTRADEPWFVLTGHTVMVGDLGRTGFERRHNQAFGMDDENEFVGAMLRDVPRSPVDAARIRAVNAGLAGAV